MPTIFGFEIKRVKQEQPSFTAPVQDDGAAVIAQGGVYGTYVDLDGSIRTEAELVTKYREMAEHPEVTRAVDNIVNEVITQDTDEEIVEIVLDNIELPEKIADMIREEFKQVLALMEFRNLSYDIFRRWYVDGRLYYHAIVDEKNPFAGIQELRYVDPRKIRKIREVAQRSIDSNVSTSKTSSEYYIYNETGFAKTSGSASLPSNTTGGIKIAKDSIVHCTSGVNSRNGDMIVSYLHEAIKPLNQLRSMEDSLIIYRISRAPERRVFYVDVGSMPPMKAEQHLRQMMTMFKNRLVYDAQTGEVRDDRKFMTMLEDFWMMRREGGRGTEITTLPGGMNLGNIEDILYFKRKLYESLKVPISRLEAEYAFSIGRATEISRDEVMFAQFINRLRNKFSTLFTKILHRQLILKGIITPEEWDILENSIKFKFARNNYWDELKNSEMMRDRLSLLRDIEDYIGKYVSNNWVRRHILHQSDEEIEQNDKEIAAEANIVLFNPVLKQAMEQQQLASLGLAGGQGPPE